tara:strand:- start:398 stop:1372 length:975 start_codon:yes stop_codon:yes gene_type:complete
MKPIHIVEFDYTATGDARLRLDSPIVPGANLAIPHGGTIALEIDSDGACLLPFAKLDAQDSSQLETDYCLSVQTPDRSVDLELLRQTRAHLLREFGLETPHGYTILGQNDLGGPPDIIDKAPEILAKSYSDGCATYSGSEAIHGCLELDIAAEIVGYLFSQPLSVGPSNPAMPTTLTGYLADLRAGRDAMQCGDFRRLFAHLAIRSGLTVRFAGLFNYGPVLPDLIAKSHAIAEIETPGGPVAIDPWFNRVFIRDGVFQSVAHLAELLQAADSGVEAVRLQPLRAFTPIGQTGSYQNVGEASFPGLDEYAGYFRYIERIPVQLV